MILPEQAFFHLFYSLTELFGECMTVQITFQKHFANKTQKNGLYNRLV